MLRKPIAWHWHILLGILAFVILLGAYTVGSLALEDSKENRTFLPSWSRLYHDGWVETTTPDSHGRRLLIEDMKATYGRLLWGLFLSAAVSLPLGLLMGCYAPIEAFFQPVLAYLAKIPGTAIFGVFLIVPFIGLTDKMYTAMIMFGIIPTLTQSIYHAAKDDVPEELLFKARTLGASQMSCIYDVIFKSIVPKFLHAIRLSVGPALIFLFAAELIMAQTGEGMGGTIRLQGRRVASGAPVVYLYVVVAGLIGLALDSALGWLNRKLCPWYYK